MGHTANEEILSVRLESACALLAQTDMPVTAIHDFCDFKNCHALNAQFRSRFRMSMTKWREKNAR
jgi:transcriptional regulator GlxA family with amidase domain